MDELRTDRIGMLYRLGINGLLTPDSDGEGAFEGKEFPQAHHDEWWEMNREVETLLNEHLATIFGSKFAIDAEVGLPPLDEARVLNGSVSIIDRAGIVGDGINFMIMVSRIAESAIKHVLYGRYPRWRAEVSVSPAARGVAPIVPVEPTRSLDQAEPMAQRESPPSSVEPQPPLLFALRTVLIAVTLLNVVIFVGGSVFTGISVSSILDKYAAAEKEIETVRDDYEAYKQSLRDRVGDVEGQIRQIGEKAVDVDGELSEVGSTVDALTVEAEQVRAQMVAQREGTEGWVTARVVWMQANPLLRTLMIVVCSTSMLFVVIFAVAWFKN